MHWAWEMNSMKVEPVVGVNPVDSSQLQTSHRCSVPWCHCMDGFCSCDGIRQIWEAWKDSVSWRRHKAVSSAWSVESSPEHRTSVSSLAVAAWSPGLHSGQEFEVYWDIAWTCASAVLPAQRSAQRTLSSDLHHVGLGLQNDASIIQTIE